MGDALAKVNSYTGFLLLRNVLHWSCNAKYLYGYGPLFCCSANRFLFCGKNVGWIVLLTLKSYLKLGFYGPWLCIWHMFKTSVVYC